MTYVYAQSTAVVGPLAVRREPHTYDLCESHARGLTAPRGWHLVRHDGDFKPPPDDLAAVAEAVREVRPPETAAPGAPAGGVRRAHLRVIPPR